MARLFISHSTVNNAEAIALRDWLAAQGWDDVFLDLDPARGILAGERWERALNEAAKRCEAVIFLVSRAWLASEWCRREFNLARRLNKRIFGMLVEDIAIADLPADMTGTWQFVNLTSGGDHHIFRAALPDGGEAHVTFSAAALQRLRAGLTKAGLDPRFFAWPPEKDRDRSPYRGLKPLEAEDAGIFFGREAEVIGALDRLRGLAEAPAPRLLVILGASGAGKSSFLRAGLWPRLRRDDRSFLPLPVIRPERAAISWETGLLRCLETACKEAGAPRNRAGIRAVLESGGKPTLALLGELASRAAPPALTGETQKTPALVFSIDQGEELFLSEGTEEAQSFLALFAEILASANPSTIGLITIRSDSYERLQTAKALEAITQQTLSLPPMAKGAYIEVIEGPARRLENTPRALRIEPSLSNALLSDIEAGGAKDALPLLAFTLERLYADHGGDGDLTLAEYRETGGVKGSIEAAVERALAASDGDPRVPQDRNARLALLRRALIPWLAGIDPETGAPRRRVARMIEIPDEARALVQHLVSARLLSTDVTESGAATVEPAHEALLRQWGLLRGWLEEDFAALSALDGVKRAKRDWEANGRDPGWLSHTGGRLDDAERFGRQANLQNYLDESDRAYLGACRERADAERFEKEAAIRREKVRLAEIAKAQQEKAAEQEQRERAQKKTRILQRVIAAVVGISALAAGVLLWLNYQQGKVVTRSLAENRNLAAANEVSIRKIAEGRTNLAIGHSKLLAELASIARDRGNYDEALRLATLGTREDPLAKNGGASLASDELARSIQEGWLLALRGHKDEVASAAFSPDGKRIVTASKDETARVFDATTGRELLILHEPKPPAKPEKPGEEPFAGDFISYAINSATFDPSGGKIVTASADGLVRVWDSAGGRLLLTIRMPNEPTDGLPLDPNAQPPEALAAAFSPDGSAIAAVTADNLVRLFNATSGAPSIVLRGHEDTIRSVAFSLDGTRIVTGSWDKTARVWNARTGQPVAMIREPDSGIYAAAFSPDGTKLALALDDMTARIVDSSSGKEIAAMRGHTAAVFSVAFSSDGTRIVTASGNQSAASDNTARIWDVATGQELWRFRGHSSALTSAAFSPDGTRIVTSSADGTARIWDAMAVKAAALACNACQTAAIALGAAGPRAITASFNDPPRSWDAASGKQLAMFPGGKFGLEYAAFDQAASRVVMQSSEDGIGVMRVADGKVLAKLGKPEKPWVVSASFSLDGSKIATANTELKSADIWDAATGKLLGTVQSHHTEKMSFAALDPSGSKIVTTSWDNTAELQDVATGDEILTLHLAHDSGPTSVPWRASFTSGGSLIATYSASNTVQLWDAATGREVQRFPVEGQGAASVAFIAGGKRLAVAKGDTVRIFGIATGQEIADFHMDGEGDPLLAVSMDGSFIMAMRGAKAFFWNSAYTVADSSQLLNESCVHRLAGASALAPDELRLTGYAENIKVDVCQDSP